VGLSAPAEPTLAPILPSRDLDATATFYGRLGFEVAGRYPPPGGYLILRGHGLELHFFAFPEHDPSRCYAGAYVRIAEVDRLHARLAEAGLAESGIPRLVPPQDKPWGMREFALIDVDGSLIRAGTPL
jgi:catechol 2,3-dioxygenase-like lactoylglutathione lyase family enzyme